MPYLARVEINNPNREVYDRLHSAMEAKSFSRVVTGALDRKRRKLPPGTYLTESYDDAWSAIAAARSAAQLVDPAAQIVIAGGEIEILFENCPEVADHPFPDNPLTDMVRPSTKVPHNGSNPFAHNHGGLNRSAPSDDRMWTLPPARGLRR